jgi:hypothetical protein
MMLNIKISESANDTELLQLRSNLQSMVDTDNTHFINFREIKKMTVDSVTKIMILLDILVILLFVLSFY